MMTGIDVKMVLQLNLVIASILVLEIPHVSLIAENNTKIASKTVHAWKAVPMDAHVTTGIAMPPRQPLQLPLLQPPPQPLQQVPPQHQPRQVPLRLNQLSIQLFLFSTPTHHHIQNIQKLIRTAI